jgi:PLP dependent protein
MFLSYDQFVKNVENVRALVQAACVKVGRSTDSVEILPVTKNHPVDAVNFAAQAGFRAVGENRVQEGLEKRSLCAAKIAWELIGHLQTNKAKAAAAHFDRVQSVDNAKLLEHLDRAAAAHNRTLSILLQVNSGRDPAKFGVELEEAPSLLELALGFKNLQVDGLMAIAPLSVDKDVARRAFANLRELRDELARQSGRPLSTLSMGMSGDLAEAIAEGSTQVRVGTAFFGART